MVAPSQKKLLSNEEKKALLRDAFREGIKPQPRLDLDEWCDKYYYLPRETSAEYGLWRTARFPFLRRVMKCMSDSTRAKEVTVIKGAQLGFTEILKAWSLYIADHCPAPTMYVQKTKDAAEDYSKQKLLPTIEVCPRMDKILGENKPAGLSDTVLNKGFPGGYLVMGGANTGSFLRSKSIKNMAADEEDSFKANIDKEGSPISMMRKRLANFFNSIFARVSTPKFKETSTIEPAYKAGSQEQYYLPCPECNPRADKGGTWFVILWGNIKYNKDKLDDSGIPVDINLLCETCGCLIPEVKKTWMLDRGRWMSVKNSEDGKPYEVGDVELPSFQISSLYSPFGFFSWRDAVMEWYEYRASMDPALHQVFINQTLGETYTVTGSDVSPNWLMDRREEYRADVPMGGLCLTCAVDVQGDRLEVEVVAWGLQGENWGVAYKVFMGNTDQMGDFRGNDPHGRPTVWKQLDDFLDTKFAHESGPRADSGGNMIANWVPIEYTLIDEGYLTEVVNTFCKNREYKRVYPVKGRPGWGKGYTDRPRDRCKKYGTYRITAWVDELKNRVYTQLKIDEPGPAYCHFPVNDEYGKNYMAGLTAEKKEVKYVNGKKVLFWYCAKGVRNEPLDLRGYNTAAIVLYSPNLAHRSEQMSIFMNNRKG